MTSEPTVPIDEALVRRLLVEQHPDLAELPLERRANGWDNEIYRLGDELAVRLPRRPLAAPLVEHERRWLPELALRLPLAVPAPVRDGRPGAGYPWRWSIVPWIAGDTWDRTSPADVRVAARDLGRFLAALHHPAPEDAPANPYRGTPLATRATRFAQVLDEVGDQVDADRCRRVFAALAAARPWPHAPRWLHGDVHPLNLLVRDGRLVAAIDFGDLCAGDPASDLAAAWIVLPAEARNDLRAAYAADALLDDDTWQRARAWALALGIAYIAGAEHGSAVPRIGHRAIARALDEA